MLPEDFVKAQKTMTMDETAKEELAAAKERSAQRRERMPKVRIDASLINADLWHALPSLM